MSSNGFSRADPESIYPVPSFGEDEEFIEDPELGDLARAVIAQRIPGFPRECRITYLWRAKASSKRGHAVGGKCVKASGLTKHFADSDFVTWLAADNTRDFGLTRHQVEALLFHELCLPGDTEVFAGELERASRRWYSGELVQIRTAAGYFLSGTPNHPVLTDCGWRPLNLLHEGDHVVSCRDPKRIHRGVHPDEDHVPARIQKIAESGRMVPLFVPEASKDFYPDIPDRQIQVVDVDSLLLGGCQAACDQPLMQVSLNRRDAGLITLPGERRLDLRRVSMVTTAPRGAGLRHGSFNRSSPLGSLKAEALGLATWTDRHAPFLQSEDDAARCRLELLAERMGGSASGIALDEIVHVNRQAFRGHVYNLQTRNNWYVANNIITHNCHIEWSEKEKESTPDHRVYRWAVKQHDFEEFHAVIAAYGAWHASAQYMALAFQMHLPGVSE